ncbi:MAG: LysR family transcriptional regulator [Chloroflexi bacterium]|nr:LysR family transcriptional regulator [Chloroflexota bacterium]
MNLRHLEVFCTVVERESYSAAAEQLIMTQPAVSMQVQVVERHFGVQLLERRRHRTVLTEAGRTVYDWAREVLSTEANARRVVDELKHARSGRVVIGATMTLGSYVLPPILSPFKREHAEAEIVVRLGERAEICNEIESGTIDCAVLIARDIPSQLDVETVGREEVIFMCAPSHRLATHDSVSVEELLNESFVMAPKGTSYRRAIDGLLQANGLGNLPVHMQLDGAEGIKRAAQQGLGIGIGFRLGAEWELQHGLLCELRIPSVELHLELGLVHGAPSSLSPMAQEFLSYLRQALTTSLSPARNGHSDNGHEVVSSVLDRPSKSRKRLAAHR